MNQSIYQPISTIKISAKEKFYWVKCPSPDDPDRLGILQSYFTDLAPKILESIEWKTNKLLQLSHPHLQSVIDIFVTENCLHIVQELGEWDCATNNLPYTPAQAKNLLTELTPVLVYLHNQGITHGNIAPESIVIDERNQHTLTNFLVVVDLITEAGGDIYPCLRSQLAEIPVLNLPTGQEWDLYSLGVTTIALLTNMDYQHLYDPVSRTEKKTTEDRTRTCWQFHRADRSKHWRSSIIITS
jgi:serine/threonine protein kinase